jgi:hypothetical protein
MVPNPSGSQEDIEICLGINHTPLFWSALVLICSLTAVTRMYCLVMFKKKNLPPLTLPLTHQNRRVTVNEKHHLLQWSQLHGAALTQAVWGMCHELLATFWGQFDLHWNLQEAAGRQGWERERQVQLVQGSGSSPSPALEPGRKKRCRERPRKPGQTGLQGPFHPFI